MDLQRLGKNWDAWGRQDPMYAVLTDPAKRHNGWDAAEFFATGQSEISEVLAYLRGLGVEPVYGSALDFGCGIGRLSQALAESFESVVGLDIAPSMIEQANTHNRHADRCRYVVNAGNDLAPIASRSIDFVYCNIVLQHMAPAYAHAYIREFFRVLRPGGIAVFFLPAAVAQSVGKPAVKTRLKTAVRDVINAVSYRVVGRMAYPQIDMFGTPRAQIEGIVAAAGGTVVDVTQDASAGDGWTGYRYCCRAGTTP